MAGQTSSRIIVISLSLLMSVGLSACVVLVPFVETDLTNSKAGRSSRLEPAQAAQSVSSGPLVYAAPKAVFVLEASRVAAGLPPRFAASRGALTTEARIRALLARLGDPNAAVRTNAATDLGLIGPQARAALGPLIRAVRSDESKWVRRAAVKALVKISCAPEVVKTLQLALGDSNEWVAHSAAGALRRIEAEQGMEQAVDIIKKQPGQGSKEIAAVLPGDY